MVAAASRYAKGGQQVGGPFVKRIMSRVAGLSLYWFARVGTRDATNSFKAYDRDFVREVGIESDTGFELGLEMVAKARRHRLPVAELPTIWLDRTVGPVELPGLGLVAPLPAVVSLRLRAEVVMKVLVSGSSGFIGGYVVEELLSRGHTVVGIDNHSKYGKVAKSYDDDPGYRLVEGDARDVDLMTELLVDCDHFIAGAAMIGGISYFHAYAYDLLATNERIMAASCDAAIKARRGGPAPEGHLHELVDGVRVHRHVAVGRGRRARRSPRRCRPTGSRSSPWSTSPGPRGTSTSCPTRSCGRSTASASARAGRSATSRCPAAT